MEESRIRGKNREIETKNEEIIEKIRDIENKNQRIKSTDKNYLILIN